MQEKQVIVVSGKNGQLGSELMLLQMSYPAYQWAFLDREALDLASEESINRVFEKYQPSYFVNCAAYTAVDKAEEERALAEQINATAVGTIAAKCKTFDATLIHISTDYVFDGNGTSPYLPEDITAPINYYGQTKREGEIQALENNTKTIIIRTAWVYSSYGKNFVKTMLRLMNEKTEISVVNDQVGAPTFARDLALVIMDIIEAKRKRYGLYHYSNEGIISWYEFAVAIKELSGLSCQVNPIPSTAFKTPAKRPKYSVLDHAKLIKDYYVAPKNWRVSLKECLQIMQRY